VLRALRVRVLGILEEIARNAVTLDPVALSAVGAAAVEVVEGNSIGTSMRTRSSCR